MLIKAVVTDIEGTTSSLSFVKDVLFPYARAQIAEFVRTHRDEEEVARLLDEVRREAGGDLEPEALIRQIIDWIDQDRKVTPLKALQGMIWEAGYREGAFNGHIYADAARNLRAWKARGMALYVYSSGSVHAQKLLFEHTEYGDLTSLFSGYFDTRIGAKQETGSYRRIAAVMGLPSSHILFLSDAKGELDAAREAGLQTIWLIRDGDLDSEALHRQVCDFDRIDEIYCFAQEAIA